MAGTAGPRTRLVDNIHAFWLFLALPGLFLVAHGVIVRQGVDYLRWSGEVSGILLILAMMVTPLMQLVGPLPWLKARRRHIGVASCLYALLHLAVWLAKADIGKLIDSFTRPDVLPGWIALAILAALALTSTDAMVRRMGPRWKLLQRFVYAAAILTLIHWAMTTEYALRVALYAIPLILLQAWRLMRRGGRSRGA